MMTKFGTMEEQLMLKFGSITAKLDELSRRHEESSEVLRRRIETLSEGSQEQALKLA